MPTAVPQVGIVSSKHDSDRLQARDIAGHMTITGFCSSTSGQYVFVTVRIKLVSIYSSEEEDS